jgi:molybdate transport system regulatory protein
MENREIKYDNIFVGYSFWLADKTHGNIISPEMWELLRCVEETRSISAAAKKMKISYRKAWDMIRSCETALGFCLFIKVRGGRDGGVTTLSPDGEALVHAYHTMIENVEKAFIDYIISFKRTLKGKNNQQIL